MIFICFGVFLVLVYVEELVSVLNLEGFVLDENKGKKIIFFTILSVRRAYAWDVLVKSTEPWRCSGDPAGNHARGEERLDTTTRW